MTSRTNLATNEQRLLDVLPKDVLGGGSRRNATGWGTLDVVDPATAAAPAVGIGDPFAGVR
jgi:hypothetical protein